MYCLSYLVTSEAADLALEAGPPDSAIMVVREDVKEDLSGRAQLQSVLDK